MITCCRPHAMPWPSGVALTHTDSCTASPKRRLTADELARNASHPVGTTRRNDRAAFIAKLKAEDGTFFQLRRSPVLALKPQPGDTECPAHSGQPLEDCVPCTELGDRDDG